MRKTCHQSWRVNVIAAGLPLGLFLSAGMILGGCAAEPKQWPMRPEVFIPAVKEFRDAACADAPKAISRHMVAAAKKKFALVTEPLADKWDYFFETSVYSACYIGALEALVMFYNPWSDTALLMLWEHAGGKRFRITDTELLTGECIRKGGKPPYRMLPLWRRMDRPAPLAVAESTYETAEAFKRAFSMSSPKKPIPRDKWRLQIPCLQDGKVLDANRIAVGLLLERNMIEIGAFFFDERYASVRDQTTATLEQLQAGKVDEVLKAADRTNTASRKIITEYLPGKWERFGVVTFAASEDAVCVFMNSNERPDFFVSFLFRRVGPRWSLKRIDVVHHQIFGISKWKKEKEGAK